MTKGEIAKSLFEEGYNCAQSVVAAFCDEIGMSKADALKLSSSFGGGMGRLREVCGAVSGMFMVAGAVKGYTSPTDDEAKKNHYALIQKMAKMFSDQCGSIICRELLNLGKDLEGPAPTPRTEQFYKKRPCGEYVQLAADITQKIIFEESVK